MFFTIVESIFSPCSPQEFMRTIAPRRLAKLPVSTEIGCASLGLLPSHGPTGNYPIVLEKSGSRQVRGGPWHCVFDTVSAACARAMGYASFICLSLAPRAVFQMAEALRIRSSFSCPSPCKSSSVRRPSRSSWANTSGRME